MFRYNAQIENIHIDDDTCQAVFQVINKKNNQKQQFYSNDLENILAIGDELLGKSVILVADNQEKLIRILCLEQSRHTTLYQRENDDIVMQKNKKINDLIDANMRETWQILGGHTQEIAISKLMHNQHFHQRALEKWNAFPQAIKEKYGLNCIEWNYTPYQQRFSHFQDIEKIFWIDAIMNVIKKQKCLPNKNMKDEVVKFFYEDYLQIGKLLSFIDTAQHRSYTAFEKAIYTMRKETMRRHTMRHAIQHTMRHAIQHTMRHGIKQYMTDVFQQKKKKDT